MGFRPTEEELTSLLAEIDEDGSGEIEIGEFCQLCATFLVEDPDMETMKRELKDAFRCIPESFIRDKIIISLHSGCTTQRARASSRRTH